MATEIPSTRRSARLGGKKATLSPNEEAPKTSNVDKRDTKIGISIDIDYESDFSEDNQFSQQFGVYKKLL